MKEAADAGHWLFQVANAFLFLSYISRDLLMLRIVLMMAGFCFVLWGSLVLTKVAVDTVVWNSVFCVINAVRATELAWQRRPIKFDREEHEVVYTEVFGPVGVSRLNFKLLVEQALLRTLRAGSTYIEAGNEATNLTLIYSGKMTIISAPKDGRPPEKVGTVERMQFVESPQWANMQVQRRKKESTADVRSHRMSSRRNTETNPFVRKGLAAKVASDVAPQIMQLVNDHAADETETVKEIIQMDVALDDDVRAASTVDVTFKADTDVCFLTWPMEHLIDFLAKNASMASPLNSIIGSDVATKLFSQAKASEGELTLDRRIYLPLDEPQCILPLNIDDHEQAVTTLDREESAVSALTKLGEKGSRGLETELIHDDEDSPLRVQRKSHITRRSSLVVEKTWLEKRGAEDTKLDTRLATILLQRTGLNKYEISALISKGRWRHIAREGTVLIREGEPTVFLSMILNGMLSVTKGEGEKSSQLHKIYPEQMVGSVELLEAETEHIAGETVISLEPVTYICWDIDDLRALLTTRPRLRAQVTTLIAIDLAAKFRQVEEMV